MVRAVKVGNLVEALARQLVAVGRLQQVPKDWISSWPSSDGDKFHKTKSVLVVSVKVVQSTTPLVHDRGVDPRI